ncbi:hypothetical protein ACIBTV_27280 [Micromonospora sp. NPDC049366]|uniref:hypothetical protein n=1 Tax=Micromonospora sp. NPDC049366 TaxID=3364271 RepID=UPI0037969604
MHISLPIHARTGLAAIGWRKPRVGETGPQPIWPVMGGSQPIGEPPAATNPPAPAPPAPTPQPPVPTPPANAPVPQPNPAPATGNGEHGFPENTPLAQMNDAQQAAYWRYHARKHEARANSMSDYEQLKAKAAEADQLRQAAMSEQERAVEAARVEGRRAALDESGAALVEQFMTAALHGRLDTAQITALISPLDRKQFLTADGLRVDTDKVNAWAAVAAPVAPAAPAVPPAQAAPPATPAPAAAPATGVPAARLDMGQGTPTVTKPSGLEAGRLLALQRHGQTSTNQPAA